MIAASWAGSSLQLSLVMVTKPPGPCKFDRRIGQDVRHAELRQRRSNGPEKNVLGRGAGDNEPADAHVIAGLNPHPG